MTIAVTAFRRNPLTGIGKPKRLKRNLAGWWSKRINEEHCLVYKILGVTPDQTLIIIQARYHY